jgi:hypothetical protein
VEIDSSYRNIAETHLLKNLLQAGLGQNQVLDLDLMDDDET